MKVDKEYKIEFAGLPLGNNKIQFQVSDDFFASHDYGEVKKGDVLIDILLIKDETILVLELELTGQVELVCDRCAHPMKYELKGSNQLIVKFSDNESSSTGEIVLLKRDAGVLHLAQNIYEFIHLLIPQKRLHKAGECNQVVMSKLNGMKDKKKFINGDPRWEGLKNLNINN